MVGEISFTEDMQPRDRTHQVIVNPETTHGVMHCRVNPHWALISVFRSDVVVHVEEIAVPFPDGLLAKSLDGVRKIEINAQSAGAHAPAFVANLLCTA